MRRACILVVLAAAACKKSPPPPPPGHYTFELDRAEAPPAGFTFAKTNEGAPGRWVVKEVSGAPEGKQVLAQVDPTPDRKRFLLAVSDAPPQADATIEVRCRMLEGKWERGCGVMFRYRDENNYYLARADAVDNNVRLYHVKDGVRARFGEFLGRVTPAEWHTLKVTVKGPRIVVWWDGYALMDIHDQTFPGPGRFGLWTKGDSITQFDAFQVRPVE